MRISDWSSDVCSSDLLAHEIHEHFHVFFLNTRYELIRGERLASGSIADCQAFPRVIIARALEIGAGAIVLAHNHPSGDRSEEHTSELQSLMRISYAVFCLKKKQNIDHTNMSTNRT